MTDDLISVDEARRRAVEAALPLRAESVRLEEALGRVLAEDVVSDVDVPPFDSSAMDGYAVVAGPAGALQVIGESRAGHPAAARLERGTAVRISTGAEVPQGADAIVPVERVEPAHDGAIQVPETRPGAHLRRAGEDVRSGDPVLGAGTVLGPAELGVLASLGRAAACCAARPRVALLLTGDELVEPGGRLGPGKIWSSNAHALAAQITRAGGEVIRRETVSDSAEDTRAALERALERADVVCVSGGVSVGPHDHVKGALAALGVERRYWGVRLKPGKPTWFGARAVDRGRVLVFGLPGNPVSAMVTFHLLARPALLRLQGTEPAASRTTAVLDEPVARNPGREQAIRCRLLCEPDGWHVRPTGEQGSHILTSMLGAGALALVPAGVAKLAAGERVDIELLD